ncbi:hypothetical protein WMF04_48570 [Sorangium sp. So ce260]|uniref:hypothetical protein n=1 Tax=Sorangium sp. So ce260 TaxID=3133291 RepID=UPI003F62B703
MPLGAIISSDPVKTTLLASTHWLMEEDGDGRVVWLVRRPVPFASIAELTSANAVVLRLIAPRHRSTGIVVDMRQASSRNDAAFEKAMHGMRAQIASSFARTAVLIATQAGLLQVCRLTREDGATSFATTSEAEALHFARGDSTGPSRG